MPLPLGYRAVWPGVGQWEVVDRMAAGEDKGEGCGTDKAVGTFFAGGNWSARLPCEQGKQSTGASRAEPSRDTRGP